MTGEPEHPVFALLHRFKADWRLALGLLVLCSLGMGYGWYYYWQVGQFDPASHHYVHWLWWPLVSDSPNAVATFFAATVAYLVWGWRHWILDSLAFVLNMYIGLWTTFLFVSYPDQLGTYNWAGALAGETANPILFVSHMGMPLLSLVLVRDLKANPLAGRRAWLCIAGILVLLAIYIFVDYWGPHIHPAPFLHPDDGVLHAGAPWLMVATAAAWLAVVWPQKTSHEEQP